MSKLLNKPFRAFTIYALIILACSIPVYYWVVDRIWLHELDDHNRIVKDMITKGLEKAEIEDKDLFALLDLWNKVQPGTSLTLVENSIKKDSTYTITRATSNEIDRFRGLAANILVKGRTYQITVETNVEEADETIAAISIVTVFFFSLLVVGFIFLNKRISKKIWVPFTSSLQKLQSFDLSKDKDLQLDQTDIEEFQQLNNALHRLIGQNMSVYQQQKVFIENASHELQTPLALLKSKMDILLQSKDMTDEQLQILEAIEQPISRMSRINKNLLLLAKIENSQFADTGQTDVSAVVEESVKLLQDYIDDKDLRLNLNITDRLPVSCNIFLLETLINNLLSNCIRHSKPSGEIRIDCQNSQIVFRNNGNPALEERGLFERFAISSENTSSSGLGLAIVKEICQRYHWGITYSFDNTFHSFTVSFS